MTQAAQKFSVGEIVVWPNGTIGPIIGIDESDGELLDAFGGWSSALDCNSVDPAVQS